MSMISPTIASAASASKWVFGYGSLIWRPDFKFVEKRVGYIKNGLRRRFYQGSTDHRGVPGAPGRVVTLIDSTIPDPFDQEVHDLMKDIPEDDPLHKVYQASFKGSQEVTFGVAYRIDDSDLDAIYAYLHHREKGGYKCYDVEVFFHSENDMVNGENESKVVEVDSTLNSTTTSTTSTTSSSTSCIAACWVATPDNEEYLGYAPIESIATQIVSSVGPSGPNTAYLLQLSLALNEVRCPDIAVDLLARRVQQLLSAGGNGTDSNSNHA